MKIRHGFVSNSSSSSFVIFGALVTEKVAQSLVKTYLNKKISIKQNTEEIKSAVGCMHDFDRIRFKFCGICGKPAWKSSKTVRIERANFSLYSEEFAIKTGVKIISSLKNREYCDYEGDYGDDQESEYYIGEMIHSDTGSSDITLKQLLKTEECIKNISSELVPKFYYEYSSE